jgi:tetratricopeptide (TPR) repeat protein
MFLAALSFIILNFITYDNYMRREGTLYLKPALGLSRSGNNGDNTVFFINKSMEKYALNPRAREIWGVIHMSHKKGKIPGHNLDIGFEEREKTLLAALKYDPFAQNNLINLAMIHLSKVQTYMNLKKMDKANYHVRKSLTFGKRALDASYYAPNAPTVYGIGLLYVGQNQEAYNHFKLALERNPSYSPALEYIERLQPLIQQGQVKP